MNLRAQPIIVDGVNTDRLTRGWQTDGLASATGEGRQMDSLASATDDADGTTDRL